MAFGADMIHQTSAALQRRSRAMHIFSIGALFILALAVSAHLLYLFGVLQSEKFLLSSERGYAEFVQYGFALIGAAAFLLLAAQQRRYAYVIPAMILAYVFIDDAFQLHEQAGHLLAPFINLTPFPHIPSNHVAEAIYLSAAGVISLACLGAAALRADASAQRNLAIFTILLLLGTALLLALLLATLNCCLIATLAAALQQLT